MSERKTSLADVEVKGSLSLLRDTIFSYANAEIKLPDTSCTMATTDTPQTFTGKTIVGDNVSNTVSANSLSYGNPGSTKTVLIDSPSAPTGGQILTISDVSPTGIKATWKEAETSTTDRLAVPGGEVGVGSVAPTKKGQSLITVSATEAKWQDPLPASSLQGASSSVAIDVSNPKANQILITTSPSEASWQNLPPASSLETPSGAVYINGTSPSPSQVLVAVATNAAIWQNIPPASSLKSLSGVVDISGSNPKGVDQVLLTSDSHSASWQNL